MNTPNDPATAVAAVVLVIAILLRVDRITGWWAALRQHWRRYRQHAGPRRW